MGVQKILCAVDFTERCPYIVDQATDLARALGAVLYVVYVIPLLDTYEQFNVNMSFREEYEKTIADQAQERLDGLIEKVTRDYNSVQGHLLTGDAAQKLLEFGRDYDIDMIVIGTHGSKKITQIFFGSVAEKIVKLSDRPVLTVKPHDCKYEPI